MRTEHQKNSATKPNPGQGDKAKGGEFGAGDPAGKIGGGLRGQQSGADEGGQGDTMNLEQQNRNKR